MHISVLICTRNRGPSLRGTLESLLHARNLAAADWELLVVDNQSTDGTAEVCREFHEKFPTYFRSLYEPKKGKSNALNAGIAAAKGDILAMTDDDAILAPDYLDGVRKVFGDPGVDVAQGRVFLQCDDGIPPWVDREMKYVLAQRDYGDEITEWKRDLVGVNMVARAEVFRKVGGFRPELGPGASGLGEDSEMAWRIHRAGMRVIYAPSIVVRHQIPKERFEKSYLRGHYFVLGKSLGHYTPLPAPIWRFGLYLVKEFVIREAAALWLKMTGHPDRALHGQCDLRLQFGMLVQHWRMRNREQTRGPANPSPS
jgi:glycosyltransferase involved in cell wall biosynthesis